jgi:DNA-binding NarL/FixJ family response regulator
MRQDLRKLLEASACDVAGETADGADALRLVEKLMPAVLVLEFNTPLLGACEVAREIRKRGLPTLVAVLSSFKDDGCVREAFRAGIRAYVNRATVATELMPALRKLEKGKYYLSPGVTDRVVKSALSPAVCDNKILTAVEMELLEGVAKDMPASDLAKQMNISLQQLDTSRTTIMQKLRISNVGGLVRHAVRQGFVQP